jgi:hypothetical protein
MYIGDGVCQARWRGVGCACVLVEHSIEEKMGPIPSEIMGSGLSVPRPRTSKQQMLLLPREQEK